MSSAWSATSFFKRVFSRSRSFIRLSLVDLQTSEFLSPSVVGVFTDLELAADLADPKPPTQFDVRFAQLRDDLLCRVPFLLSHMRPSKRPEYRDSRWTDFWGAGHSHSGYLAPQVGLELMTLGLTAHKNRQAARQSELEFKTLGAMANHIEKALLLILCLDRVSVAIRSAMTQRHGVVDDWSTCSPGSGFGEFQLSAWP